VKAVVVGAGLAGLVAARTLHRSGWEVVVLEASEGIGGRVRTDVVQGFRLDRGFQVLFTAYPAAKRQLDLKALQLRRLDAGAVVVEGGRWSEVGDPFRDVKSLLPSALSSLATAADKRSFLRLRRQLHRQALLELEPGDELTSADFLRHYGFSDRCIELFWRGLAGALFLDRSLWTSAWRLQSELKMLTEGRAAVPRRGMQAIPDQIAAGLPEIRLETPALRLLRQAERVVGVQTGSADIEADAVVVAAHAPQAERLSGIEIPKDANSATCLYFHLPYPLYGNRKVILNGYRDGCVNHALQITNVAPSYAPQPEHLLSATILGAPDQTVEQLTARALEDMQRWFPWRSIGGLKALAVYQVPFGRLVQPPGFGRLLPQNRTAVPGLYLAGEYTAASSIDGAMASGEKAAQIILAD